MVRFRFMGLGLTLGAMVLTTATWCQDNRLSVQFDQTPLSQVLASFQRLDPTLQYALPAEFTGLPVTASLVDVTARQAVSVILAQSGLAAVDDGGVLQIRRQSQPRVTRVARPLARLAAPTFITRPAGGVSAPTNTPAATTSSARPGGATAPGQVDTKSLPLQLIMIKYADPGDIAYLFGGDVVQGGGLYGNGGGSTGYGNYGDTGSSGSYGYGSNSNTTGSTRGRSRNTGNDSGYSNTRSNRRTNQ